MLARRCRMPAFSAITARRYSSQTCVLQHWCRGGITQPITTHGASPASAAGRPTDDGGVATNSRAAGDPRARDRGRRTIIAGSFPSQRSVTAGWWAPAGRRAAAGRRRYDAATPRPTHSPPPSRRSARIVIRTDWKCRTLRKMTDETAGLEKRQDRGEKPSGHDGFSLRSCRFSSPACRFSISRAIWSVSFHFCISASRWYRRRLLIDVSSSVSSVLTPQTGMCTKSKRYIAFRWSVVLHANKDKQLLQLSSRWNKAVSLC